ncbi:MAG: NADH-quinone oxidoreductase subunit C [Candidatus Lokiarchaeota archaeon]|nr:NADH-quinone oxidoreductase subunit C [Candidatus Lokiarchaeota archaeon]
MIHSMQELKAVLGERFDLGVKNVQSISDDELVVSGRDDKMLELLDYLSSDCDARLVAQVVNDGEGSMELIDILFMNHLRSRVYVKVDIDARDKKVTTIADIFPTAKWVEKYQSQFLAIDFQPRPVHQKDQKDVEGTPSPDEGIPWVPFQADDIVDKARMPGGPGIFDPKLDLFSYTWVKTDKTVVSANRCQLGHYHRGMIKYAESLAVPDLPPAIARTCWRDKWHALAAVSVAVERAAGVDAKIPHHAAYWRALCCELERVRNHHEFLISWLHLAGHIEIAKRNVSILRSLDALERHFFDDATDTPFLVPGGITHDPVATGKVSRPTIEEALRSYEEAIAGSLLDPIEAGGLFDAFDGVGRIRRDAAIKAGMTGPALRASGVPYDARTDFPQGPYKQGLLRWDTCTGIAGDVRARIEIHAHEIVQSLRIMYQLNALLAETPVAEASRVDVGGLAAGVEGFAVVESARGELHAYVKASKEAGKLHTLRIVPPSFQNYTALERAVGSVAIRKMPYVVHSINPCWACIDQ